MKNMVRKHNFVEGRMRSCVQAEIVDFVVESVWAKECIFGLHWLCQHFKTWSNEFTNLVGPLLGMPFKWCCALY